MQLKPREARQEQDVTLPPTCGILLAYNIGRRLPRQTAEFEAW